jgi:hypothetical protein
MPEKGHEDEQVELESRTEVDQTEDKTRSEQMDENEQTEEGQSSDELHKAQETAASTEEDVTPLPVLQSGFENKRRLEVDQQKPGTTSNILQPLQ